MTDTHEYAGTETLRDSAGQVVRSLIEQQRTGDDLVRVGAMQRLWAAPAASAARHRVDPEVVGT